MEKSLQQLDMIHSLRWFGIAALDAITFAVGTIWFLTPTADLPLATMSTSMIVSRP